MHHQSPDYGCWRCPFAGGENLELACWDKKLRGAAHGHGFTLAPERL